MYYRFYFFLLFTAFVAFPLSGQTIQKTTETQQLLDAFSYASKTYNIPADLLKAVAYEQTRFTNIIDSDSNRSSGEQPPLYGIMGLRNDDWFGHSLLEGAKLINQPPSLVATNASLNIEAAAALLSAIADSLKIDRTNLNNWRPVLEEFSGIPQDNIKPFFTFDVFKVLSDGTTLKSMDIPKYTEINMNQFSKEVNPNSTKRSLKKVADQSDYPPAVWSPSPNFYNDDNFNQLFLVVHDTEGPFASSLSWLQNPASNASAHYIIRSSDGYIVQMVHEKYAAWHVVCWNRYMLGVEHEGYISNPSYFTEAMYKASAGLFRHFIETWGVPLNRNRVIGHYQWEFPDWVNFIKKNYPYIDPTCNSHTDPGQYWDWNHYFSLIKSYATVPKALTFFPITTSTDSVWPNTPIKITFSIAMSDTTIQKGFKITPSASGTFKLSDHAHTLIFTPSSALEPQTKYTISIGTQSTSILGVPLDTTYSFSFITRALIPVVIQKSYPRQNETEVSSTVKVLYNFNIPLIKSSLGGRVIFQDSSGNSVSIKSAIYNEYNGKGVVSFLPSRPLAENAAYKLILKAGIQSIIGTQLDSNYVINFTTGTSNFTKGVVIDSFENTGSWKSPTKSLGTNGIDSAKSGFALLYGTYVDGQYSGRISYFFNVNSGGVCSVTDGAEPNIGISQDNKFGMWIFGDDSYNYLAYQFINSSQDISIIADTLDYTGWKFVEIPLSEVGSSGNILFSGVSIIQNPAGTDSNMIYIDGAQYSNPNATGIENNKLTSTPYQFKLNQNYPNPFNPSTIISYQIPKSSFVSLKVYDILGREVTSLVNAYEQAGSHQIEFNTEDMKRTLTSGIYFYTLKAGKFTKTKKLVLMK
jgi:N-acetyl-anhydromuramyl-L-alanine amidase AmpD